MWQRLNYRTHDLLQRSAKELRSHHLQERQREPPAPGSEQLLPQPYDGDLQEDDAFDTIIQWLYWRIPFVKGLKEKGAETAT